MARPALRPSSSGDCDGPVEFHEGEPVWAARVSVKRGPDPPASRRGRRRCRSAMAARHGIRQPVAPRARAAAQQGAPSSICRSSDRARSWSFEQGRSTVADPASRRASCSSMRASRARMSPSVGHEVRRGPGRAESPRRRGRPGRGPAVVEHEIDHREDGGEPVRELVRRVACDGIRGAPADRRFARAQPFAHRLAGTRNASAILLVDRPREGPQVSATVPGERGGMEQVKISSSRSPGKAADWYTGCLRRQGGLARDPASALLSHACCRRRWSIARLRAGSRSASRPDWSGSPSRGQRAPSAAIANAS